MRKIPPSELIINSDGTIFHLHIKPSQLADKVILVGDPSNAMSKTVNFIPLPVLSKVAASLAYRTE